MGSHCPQGVKFLLIHKSSVLFSSEHFNMGEEYSILVEDVVKTPVKWSILRNIEIPTWKSSSPIFHMQSLQIKPCSCTLTTPLTIIWIIQGW